MDLSQGPNDTRNTLSLRLELRLTQSDSWSELSERLEERNDFSLGLPLRLIRNDTGCDYSWCPNDTMNAFALHFRLRLTLNDT